MPRTIQMVHAQMPEKVQQLYAQYPFEIYAEPLIKERLRRMGIYEHRLEYQECYDAAMEAYLFSIHRCALCSYEHVAGYIRKMVRVAIILGLNITHEGRNICKMNHLQQIQLDALERKDRW